VPPALQDPSTITGAYAIQDTIRMMPALHDQLDLTKRCKDAPLATSGFTEHLISFIRDARGEVIPLERVAHLSVSVIEKLQFNQPLLCFSVGVYENGSAASRGRVSFVKVTIPENELPARARNALWQTVPALAIGPEGVARTGTHEPLESIGSAMAQNLHAGQKPKAGYRRHLVDLTFPTSPDDISLTAPSLASLEKNACENPAEPLLLACDSMTLPQELSLMLNQISAPWQSGIQGSALMYVQTYLDHVILTKHLTSIGDDGCWHPLASHSEDRSKSSEADFLEKTALLSLTAQPNDLYPHGSFRSPLELCWLLMGAAALHEFRQNKPLNAEEASTEYLLAQESWVAQRQLHFTRQALRYFERPNAPQNALFPASPHAITEAIDLLRARTEVLERRVQLLRLST
jgi:hypothetical protein